jgi:hypothetical protein
LSDAEQLLSVASRPPRDTKSVICITVFGSDLCNVVRTGAARIGAGEAHDIADQRNAKQRARDASRQMSMSARPASFSDYIAYRSGDWQRRQLRRTQTICRTKT